MPDPSLPAQLDGLLDDVPLEAGHFVKLLPRIRELHQQVQHHLELNSFDPPDLPQWERAAERLRKFMERLERAVEEATLIKLLAALLTTAAQQPSDEQAAIDVVVVGEEVCAALSQNSIAPAQLNVLLPPLVDVCRAFNKAYSDEHLKLQSLREAVLQAKQAFAEPSLDVAKAMSHRLPQDTHVDVDLVTAQRDLARRTVQLSEELLEKRAELDAELAKGKRRELVACVVQKLGFELPKKGASEELRPELYSYNSVLWEGGEAQLLHTAIGYPISLCVDGEQSERRSINAVRQLLACGVSPDAKVLNDLLATPLSQCAAKHEPECAKLLLRAGATITKRLAILMAGSEIYSEARLLVERALEPWSPANHELFPDAARLFAVQLLLIGKRLSARPDHAPLATLWLEMIMPAVVDRDAH